VSGFKVCLTHFQVLRLDLVWRAGVAPAVKASIDCPLSRRWLKCRRASCASQRDIFRHGDHSVLAVHSAVSQRAGHEDHVCVFSSALFSTCTVVVAYHQFTSLLEVEPTLICTLTSGYKGIHSLRPRRPFVLPLLLRDTPRHPLSDSASKMSTYTLTINVERTYSQKMRSNGFKLCFAKCINGSYSVVWDTAEYIFQSFVIRS